VSNTAGTTGPFGTVHVSLDVTTQVVTFTFTANTGAGFHFIDGGSAAVNLSTTFNNFTLILDPDFKGTSTGNVDGFGLFNLVIDNKSASTLVDSISFSVHNTGTKWDSLDDILAFNNKGADAAAHVNFGNGLTGFVAETGRFTVPDGGSTVAFLGAGLTLLCMIRRKMK